MTKKKLLMRTDNVAHQVSNEIASAVGHIVTTWARLEWLCRIACYNLVGVDPKIGRIAIRQPRPEDSLEMIGDLLALRRRRVATNLKELSATVRDLQKRRDSIAHGLWCRHSGTGQLILQVTGGTWNLGPRSPRFTKRMYPEGREITSDQLDELRCQIDAAVSKLLVLNDQIREAMHTSTGIVVELVRSNRHPRDRS